MDHAQKIRRARNSTSRKKGKRKRTQKQDKEDASADTNAAIVPLKAKDQKEAERRERIEEELAAQADSKWTSRKKRRLEKYIDSKLKKEERACLFAKLAETQAATGQPSSLLLQASGSLGTGKPATHQERLARQEDRMVRRAIDGLGGSRKRGAERYTITYAGEGGGFEDSDNGLDAKALSDLSDGDSAQRETRRTPSLAEDVRRHTSLTSSGLQDVLAPSVAGSALRRKEDGSVMVPTIQAKRTKASFRPWKDKRKKSTKSVPEDVSDSSFDSSDAENDTPNPGNETGDAEDNGTEHSGHSSDTTAAPEPDAPQKNLGFKDWAIKQMHAAKGYDPPVMSTPLASPTLPEPGSPRPKKKRRTENSPHTTEMRGPLGEDLKLPDTSFAQRLGPRAASSTKTKAVLVKRPADVEEARLLLPIVTEEQPIMEAILLNPVVIICGETGSGKTTQVPQFLYEAGFGSAEGDQSGMIGITQPRRVAAMSMAARVAHELSLTTSRVSYQIRYDATVSPSTSIKFMTDGVLLRELAADFLLTKYSVIVIDEAHERSINTDILIGVLSRVLKLRENMWKEGKEGVKPLRLVIMSATLKVSDFAENRSLFPISPPIINVAARQHPVTVHFSRRTSPDYVTEAIKKTVKIHTRLPPGGILIFLTGQNEIIGVCRKLEARFGAKAVEDRRRRRGAGTRMDSLNAAGDDSADVRDVGAAHADVEAEEVELGEEDQQDLALDVDGHVEESWEDPEALDSDGDRTLDEELGIFDDVPMHVLPLYSLLPSEKQMHVFQPPPPGSRLVVVSTNVAETSLTIPGIRYMVDCGRAKERRHDIKNGIQTFTVSWISKASAAQRAGRAGRTGPGHCYRLYSSALFEHHFNPFTLPEIQRMPIEGVVLQMKSMHIDQVVNFPFPTPPERSTLEQAEKVLTHLGVLSHRGIVSGPSSFCGQITALGNTMALFPLSPRFSRMLVSGQQHGCLPYVITIVAALSVGDPFLHNEGLSDEGENSIPELECEHSHLKSENAKAKESRRLHRKAFFDSQHTHASLGQFTSDIFKMLSVVGAYEYAGGGHKFCSDHFVRPKAMEEIHKLRAQISHIVQVNFPELNAGFVSNLLPPSTLQLKVLRQLLTAGFIDQVAVRKDRVAKDSSSGEQYASSKGVPYRALGISEDVFIHPSSVLASKSPPEYLVFNEVLRTTRVWLKGLTVVNPAWLSSLGKPSLCTFSKPMKNMSGIMMTIPRFGPEGWELPAIEAKDLKK